MSATYSLTTNIMNTGQEKIANIEMLLCEAEEILWSSVIPAVKSDITEALEVELPRFLTEIKLRWAMGI